jgi:hypothetical protein
MLINTNVGCIGGAEGTEWSLAILVIIAEYLNLPKYIYLV